MADVRSLVAQAQAAEIRGDVEEAIRLLGRAAELARDAGNPSRALKFLRQMRRLRGEPVDLDTDAVVLPADDADGGVPAEDEPEFLKRGPRLIPNRGPALADPSLAAWCSFCCRPAQEVGALVGGPTGAFGCRACLQTSAGLLGTALPELVGTAVAVAMRVTAAPAVPPMTAHQQQVFERLTKAPGRCLVLIGPPGAGKSFIVEAIAPPVDPERFDDEAEIVTIEVEAPISVRSANRVLEWLAAAPQRRIILSTRAVPPAPIFTLKGPVGEEPVYDSRGLETALGHVLPRAFIERVDAMVALPEPSSGTLLELAKLMLAARPSRTVVSDAALRAMVEAAGASGRGAHELAALVERIPPGEWA